MTDAVEAALSRRASGALVSTGDPVEEALSRRTKGEKVSQAKATNSLDKPPGGYSSPYAYYTPEVQRSLGNTGEQLQPVVGAGEAALQTGTGLLSSAVGGAAGAGNFILNHSPVGYLAHKLGMPESESADVIKDFQEAGTYQPRTFAGEVGSQAVSDAFDPNVPTSWLNPLQVPANVGKAIGGFSAEHGGPAWLSTGLEVAPQVLAPMAAAKGVKALRAAEKPAVSPPTTQELLNKSASNQSMGAAGAAVDLQKLSPELRGAVEKAVQKTGGAVNPEVLARQIQADSLPVKVRLSEGQALGDERLISIEQNARGKHEAYSKGFQEQNKALVENLRTFRDEAGPDVFSTNSVEHGDTLISRYKAIDDEKRAEISAKYKALEEANGGQFPVNGGSFVNAADVALSSKMKGRYLPKEIRGDLEEFKDNAGFMTFEQFENLRTNLAAESRKAERSGDGNAAAAVNIVRRELENLPMSGETQGLKALADDARKSAKARFDALDADPAYKAAVNDSVAPDNFIQKFVINDKTATRDNVARLSEAMNGDEAAMQTVKVATLDHLRKAAGIDPQYNGNFTQAGYNKALQQLSPKLQSLLDAKTVEQVTTLGDVARYTQFQPKGSYVNNSNTFVAAAGEKAADALEGALNYKTGGIPIASAIRKQLGENRVRKQAEATFAPGAGLVKLNELLKGKGKP